MNPPPIEHYLVVWNLSAPRLLTETHSSHLYLVTQNNSPVILKLLKPFGGEGRSGAAALRYYNGHGAVRLLHSDDNAHLLEYADGDDLVGMVKQGQDAQATTILADVMNQLHHAPVTAGLRDLIPLHTWFSGLFKQADTDRHTGIHSIYTKAALIAEHVLTHPLDTCILHGDIHHENVRFKEGRGWLAFDPKGLLGERTFDAASVVRDPQSMLELVENETRILKTVDILAEKMGLAHQRLLIFVYLFCVLSASWSLDDGDEAISDLRIATLVEPHLPLIG